MQIYNSNSLVNLSNSILKHYNVQTFHDTIPEIDKILEGKKKVVLVLFDGMGKNIRDLHLPKDSFIQSHRIHTINSTFPPTTAAATTAVLSAKFPIETGWLGWDLYFPEYDRNVILFTNQDYNTHELLQDRSKGQLAMAKFPYKSIFELIKDANPNMPVFDIKIKPASPKGPSYYWQAKRIINKSLKQSNECFMYFYWDNPDRTMHRNGINCKKTHKQVMLTDKFMKQITKKNPDTLFLVVADHGHINVEYCDYSIHQDLCDLMYRKSTLESRAMSFFVKKENKEKFIELFGKYYGEFFELVDTDEALKANLFGDGKPAKGIRECLGEFIAISKDKYCLYSSKDQPGYALFPGHHAGGTKQEREIDISAICRNDE